MAGTHSSHPHPVGVTVPVGPAGVAVLLPRLVAALEGGPALAVLPEVGRFTTPAMRQSVLDALRPDDPAAPVEHDDVALLVSTSGSTGDPRGVHWTRAALHHSVTSLHDRLGGPGDWLLALPVTSAAGLMALVRTAVAGTTAHTLPSLAGAAPFSVADVVDCATRARAHARRLYVSLIDEQARRLASSTEGLAVLTSLDAVLLGGGPVDDVAQRLRDHGVPVVTSYGMTETCGGCVYDGRPLPGVGVDIDHQGRITINGPVVSPGYRLRRDDDAFRDGAFITRDIGVMQDGILRVQGRIDDAVKVDGVLVDLGTVAALAQSVTGATAAVARPAGDGRGVEVVIEAEEIATQEVVAAIRDRLAVRVSDVLMVEPGSLPRLPGGKIDVRSARVSGDDPDAHSTGPGTTPSGDARGPR